MSGLAVAALAAAWFTLTPGARLHRDPDASSPPLTIVDAELQVEELAESGDWVLVRYLGNRGWVRRTAPDETVLEAMAGGLHDRAGDLLDAARNRLGASGREVVLERFRLFTDVADETLLSRLERAALDGSRIFLVAFRLVGVPRSGSAIVLFSREEDARGLDDLACGRARARVAFARAACSDPDASIRRVLHQAGHLYAVELFGDTIPPWLEEGIADAWASLGERDVLAPVERPPDGDGQRAPLRSALTAGRELFLDDARGRSLRRESRTFVRYLWCGGAPSGTGAFRDLLAKSAERVPLTISALERLVGGDVATLQQRSRAWEKRGREKGWRRLWSTGSLPTPLEP